VRAKVRKSARVGVGDGMFVSGGRFECGLWMG
jgi:hypothetical protein